MINGCSLFSNVGIDETYFNMHNINMVLANELKKERCQFYKNLYPNSEIICGDITDIKIFNILVNKYKEKKCEFLIATPPCQGMSVAGKMNPNDLRNKLIIQVIEFIKKVKPKNIIIENVPGILKFDIIINNKKIKILDYIINSLESIGYYVNYDVLDAADYNTPQYRKRAIFLISNIGKWEFPKKSDHQITVREAIGELPSLESGEDSGIKYHKANIHNPNHILWMRHTPTGKTAFDNEVYFPNINGRRIKGYSTTYKRIDWDKPAPTITMCNGGISSQNNVHPGRKLENGTYSDARVLTILELLRLMGLPDDWNIPQGVSDGLVRKVLGEAFPPRFSESMITTMPIERGRR